MERVPNIPNDALTVEHEGPRDPDVGIGDAVELRDRVFALPARRPQTHETVESVLLEIGGGGRGGRVGADQHGDDALLGVRLSESGQMGQGLSAGRAPGSPELEDHNVPTVVGQHDLLSVRGLCREIGGGCPEMEADRRAGVIDRYAQAGHATLPLVVGQEQGDRIRPRLLVGVLDLGG